MSSTSTTQATTTQVTTTEDVTSMPMSTGTENVVTTPHATTTTTTTTNTYDVATTPPVTTTTSTTQESGMRQQVSTTKVRLFTSSRFKDKKQRPRRSRHRDRHRDSGHRDSRDKDRDIDRDSKRQRGRSTRGDDKSLSLLNLEYGSDTNVSMCTGIELNQSMADSRACALLSHRLAPQLDYSTRAHKPNVYDYESEH